MSTGRVTAARDGSMILHFDREIQRRDPEIGPLRTKETLEDDRPWLPLVGCLEAQCQTEMHTVLMGRWTGQRQMSAELHSEGVQAGLNLWRHLAFNHWHLVPRLGALTGDSRPKTPQCRTPPRSEFANRSQLGRTRNMREPPLSDGRRANRMPA